MHSKTGCVALVLAGALLTGCGQPGWKLVWQDEFAGAAGQAPDPANWGYDVGTGTGGWGNGEQEYYRPDNAALDGAGHLAITAKQEEFQGSHYTSARLLTQGKHEFTRGRFEARIKLPKGQGIWPAFWLLGANIDTVGWPACGELDVMEERGQDPSTVLGSMHGPGYSGAGAVSDAFHLPGAVGFDGDFHVFAIEWDAQYVAWEVDGVTYEVATPTSLPAGTAWVFDHPMFLILNLAVGGNFLGLPDATTVFPQTMLVDYVRVYEAT
jgi:beta-glucanase (GH16 family)